MKVRIGSSMYRSISRTQQTVFQSKRIALNFRVRKSSGRMPSPDYGKITAATPGPLCFYWCG
ncbi:hypothetical protein [Telluribacter sp.]|uniref:hypothetical protein n=1 Tax=Telluribacter sp. TaxID=1978767 RepID=UPI002E15CEEA